MPLTSVEGGLVTEPLAGLGCKEYRMGIDGKLPGPVQSKDVNALLNEVLKFGPDQNASSNEVAKRVRQLTEKVKDLSLRIEKLSKDL